MYWQVYLHHTVVSSEQVLLMLLKRAQVLTSGGIPLFATPALSYFLGDRPGRDARAGRKLFLEMFAALDDNDVLSAAKVWVGHSDRVLSILARGLVHRELFSVELNNDPFGEDRVAGLRREVSRKLSLTKEEAEFLVVSDSVSNYAYSDMDDRITILDKRGGTRDIADASDMLNIAVLSKTVRKYFLCYPRFMKELS